MRVFISWSGSRSKLIAEALRGWLPSVIQATKPYYTPDDITKGARWGNDISAVLEDSKIGLICLTKENITAPWILFEAGALSKNIDNSKVVPILFGVEPTDLEGPLVQFQAAKFQKKEIQKIVEMINQELGDAKLPVDVLNTVFEMWWPKLEKDITPIMEMQEELNTRTARSDRDLLEEILLTLRAQAKGSIRPSVQPDAAIQLTLSYIQLVEKLGDLSTCPEIKAVLKDLFLPVRHIFIRCVYEEKIRNDVSEILDRVGDKIELYKNPHNDSGPQLHSILEGRRKDGN